MSLQVWLPLNDGSLTNLGIALNITFSMINSSYTSFTTGGKIGQCLSNTSLTQGGLISNTTINLTSTQSMFCWFKFTSLESTSNLGCGLVSQHRYSTNQGMGITIKYISSTTGYLSVNTGTSSSRTYNTYCGTTLLQANTWYHGGYTYNGSTIKIYVNGICEKTLDLSGMSVPADYLMVGCWSLNSSSGSDVHSGYKLNGYINDVRIYNNALSSEEVKKISQGLILHYPLNDGYIELTKNIAGAISNLSSTWTFNKQPSDATNLPVRLTNGNIMLKGNGNSSTTQTYMTCNSFSILPNTTYTLSIRAKVGSGARFYIYFYERDANGSYITHTTKIISTPTAGFELITLTATTQSNTTQMNIELNNNTGALNSEIILLKNSLLVEVGSHATAYTPSQRGAQYDKAIYQEPDGSLWVRMFHHNNPAGGLFALNDTFTTGVYKDTDRWFDIYGVVNLLSRYEFMCKLKNTSGGDSTELKYRWILKVSPIIATYEDIKPANITMITTSGYSSGYGGLFRNGSSNTHFVICDGSAGDWWGATGCTVLYSGGIPGYPTNVCTSGYMDLYARIDNNSLNNIDFSKIYDTSGFKNDGVAVGALLINPLTKRYNAAIKNTDTAYVHIAPNLNIANDFLFTFSIWANAAARLVNSKLVTIKLNNGLYVNFGDSTSANTPQMFIFKNTGYYGYLTGNANSFLPLNEWHHYAGVFNGSSWKVYKDGTLIYETSSMSSYSLDMSNLHSCLFSSNLDTGTHSLGMLSDFRIYATALSADDVAALYRLGTST